MYVSLETLRRAVSLVDSLAQLDDPACFAGIVLPGLSTLVGCDVLTYNEIGSASGETRYADYPAGARDPATQPVFAAYVHEHPLVNHYRATGSGEPVMISDFLSRQRFHRLGLYAEFFRGIPVEHQMAISLPGPDEQVIGVALSRARRDFRDSDRALLSALRAPLIAALQRARRRQQAGQVLNALACGGLASLTDREIQIMRLVAAGRTNIAIAHKLDVSPRTIAKHLEHIYRKLEVSSRAAAVSRIVLVGAQDPSPRRSPPMATYRMVYGDDEQVVRETFENIDGVEREDGWVVLFAGRRRSCACRRPTCSRWNCSSRRSPDSAVPAVGGWPTHHPHPDTQGHAP